MFYWSGFVLQEPELLLGQATPDPDDLPGAHRERPVSVAMEKSPLMAR